MIQRDGESRSTFRKRRWREQSRTLDAAGNIKSIIEVRRGRHPDHAPAVGVPLATSTLFDKEGRVTAQWIKTGQERHDPEQFARALAAELKEPIPHLLPILALNAEHYSDDLLTDYPVGDLHMGMLSWRPETGASYDIEIAERLLTRAFQHLVPLAPRCKRAVIPFLGDLLHYDSEVPETPHGKVKLDADSRYQKMIRAGRRMIQNVISIVAEWHEQVDVIFLPGNHDPHSMTIISELFSALYEENPRITISTVPRPYRYLAFGKVLLGFTHGDLTKPEALPEIMAADCPAEWGASEYRYWQTGHVHSRNAKDFRGVSWESFRVLAPADAWAASRGYRSIRDMQAIVYHTDHGEVARHTVNPKMLGL